MIETFVDFDSAWTDNAKAPGAICAVQLANRAHRFHPAQLFYFAEALTFAEEAAGLPGLRVHDLRHSAASAMVSSGVDLLTVGRILGHRDHKSTMRYSHLADDALLAAVERGAVRLQAAA